jgi:asparagine N-glycosylation enzyme membrane subunit Stt3
MNFVWNLITPINVAFCSAIFVLGLLRYLKRKDRKMLCVGIAFALFGVSHVLAIVSWGGCSEVTLLVSRIIAYLLVVISMLVK